MPIACDGVRPQSRRTRSASSFTSGSMRARAVVVLLIGHSVEDESNYMLLEWATRVGSTSRRST